MFIYGGMISYAVYITTKDLDQQYDFVVKGQMYLKSEWL